MDDPFKNRLYWQNWKMPFIVFFVIGDAVSTYLATLKHGTENELSPLIASVLDVDPLLIFPYKFLIGFGLLAIFARFDQKNKGMWGWIMNAVFLGLVVLGAYVTVNNLLVWGLPNYEMYITYD